jgi:predicted DNA-binding protein YlxM (UPF0122 family)
MSNKFFENLTEEEDDCEKDKEEACYLWPTNSWVYNYKSHPKTKKILAKYNKIWEKLLNKTKIINKDNIKKNKDFLLAFEWKIVWEAASLETQLVGFQKIVTNELMRYNLFINYYTLYLNNPQLQPMSLSFIEWYNIKEISDSVTALKVSQKAVFRTMSSLKNIYVTFPIHIWMLAYQEDIVNFMWSLKKLYTPLHQMYYKYQKVQEK